MTPRWALTEGQDSLARRWQHLLLSLHVPAGYPARPEAPPPPPRLAAVYLSAPTSRPRRRGRMSHRPLRPL